MRVEAVLVCKLAPGHEEQGEIKKEADLSGVVGVGFISKGI